MSSLGADFGSKERALLQIRATLRDTAELIGVMLCALAVAVALYILTGGM